MQKTRKTSATIFQSIPVYPERAHELLEICTFNKYRFENFVHSKRSIEARLGFLVVGRQR